MKILLRGYFNHNLGDDFMIKHFIKNTPHIMYVIPQKNEYTRFLEQLPNVVFDDDRQETGPVLTVTGSGFMVNCFLALVRELKNRILGRERLDYCIGCNIEPFRHLLSSYLIAKRLGACRLITCRDRASLAWLKKHCPGTETAYYPDILFSLPAQAMPKPAPDGTLGITVMKTGDPGLDSCFIANIAQIIDWYTENTGFPVALLAFSVGTEADECLCGQIKAAVTYPNRVRIVAYEGDGSRLLEQLSRCTRLIAFRFHSAVLAMKMGIPLYPVLYRDKMKNLISDMDYPIRGTDIRGLTVQKVSDFLLSEPPQYQLPACVESEAKKHITCFADRF